MHLPSEEVRVEIQARNNRLCQLIFAGWPSVIAFCQAAGCNRAAVDKLLNLTGSPLDKRGGYTVTASRLAAFFGLEPAELFPAWIYQRVVKPRSATALPLAELPRLEQAVKALVHLPPQASELKIDPLRLCHSLTTNPEEAEYGRED